MVVLADEILESFFETDLSASFRLEILEIEVPLPQSNSGFLGGLISSIVTDDNKKIFNRFTDEIGKSIGRHQVSYYLFLEGRLALIRCAGYPQTDDWTFYEITRAQSS